MLLLWVEENLPGQRGQFHSLLAEAQADAQGVARPLRFGLAGHQHAMHGILEDGIVESPAQFTQIGRWRVDIPARPGATAGAVAAYQPPNLLRREGQTEAALGVAAGGADNVGAVALPGAGDQQIEVQGIMSCRHGRSLLWSGARLEGGNRGRRRTAASQSSASIAQ